MITSFSSQRVRLEIDLDAIRRNYQLIAKSVAPLQVMAVLKANAYGLGVRPIAECLAKAGVSRIGVAELREALAICDLGIPVQILGGVLPEEIPEAIQNQIILPIHEPNIAYDIDRWAKKLNQKARCHFLIDTGMGRLGLRYEQAFDIITQLIKLDGIVFEGIYSHFPFAYSDYDFSVHQVSCFTNLLNALQTQGISFSVIHMANSDAIHNIPPALKSPFTMVRTGINLYGCFDLEGRQTIQLEPVLKLVAKLVSKRYLPWGSSIGYGRTCRLQRDTWVGTVTIGYADGLPLSLSNKGYLMIRHQRCPILGRISMDYTTIDLSNVPDAQVGDDVVCLGDEITVADWARAKNTIPYEIICSFGNRVTRIYLSKDQPNDPKY